MTELQGKYLAVLHCKQFLCGLIEDANDLALKQHDMEMVRKMGCLLYGIALGEQLIDDKVGLPEIMAKLESVMEDNDDEWPEQVI